MRNFALIAELAPKRKSERVRKRGHLSNREQPLERSLRHVVFQRRRGRGKLLIFADYEELPLRSTNRYPCS